MIQKTIHKRAKSKFKMSVMTARIKRKFRKKYKKTISKSKIIEVWKDYVEIAIKDELIKKGKVQIDKHFSLEIVGMRLVDDKKRLALQKNGLVLMKGGGVRKATERVQSTRDGFTYKIEMTEPRFKEGLLIFEADKKIKQAMVDSLQNTNKYYRIKDVN